MMWGPYGGYGYMSWMPFMGVFWPIVLFLIGAAVLGLFRRSGGISDWHGDQRSPGLAILEERYARGEINRDEYLQKKKDILSRT